MSEPKTQTLDLPGATLSYDVRETASESTEPVLLVWSWPATLALSRVILVLSASTEGSRPPKF